MSVDGSPLASVDVKNAQPLLLAACVCRDHGTSDAVEFKKLAESGNLYEMIQDDCGIEERKVAKKAFLRYVFSRVDRMAKSAETVSSWIETHFPTVGKYCRLQKLHGHKKLAHTLQRAERSIVIDRGVAGYHRQTHQNAFCATLHDSLIVPNHATKAASEAILEAFRDVGVRAKTSTEYWEWY